MTLFILQTSGTAAQPKLIPFSHSNMLAGAARLQAWFDLTPWDRCLSVSPPHYSHGLKVTIFRSEFRNGYRRTGYFYLGECGMLPKGGAVIIFLFPFSWLVSSDFDMFAGEAARAAAACSDAA
jgi:acyl-CoA synthetase (AMP-forming)/AMP-acid ligase II